MKDWQVVIPFIGPDWLLEGCLESAGVHSVPLMIVDNHTDNIGVAASWNKGLREGADKTLLLSAAMRFPRGLDTFIEEADMFVSRWGLRLCHAWHAVVLTRRLVELVGEFDEEFWPCEYEDTDYMRRMRLSGVWWSWLPEANLDLTCVGNSIAGQLGLVPKSDLPRIHYEKKWGGQPGSETYICPFDDC